MNKKSMILIFSVFLLGNIYSQSIADFTLVYEPTGEFINFYDNPSDLFSLINKEDDTKNIENGFGKEYNFSNCSFEILHRKIENLKDYQVEELQKDFNVTDPEDIYLFYNIEVFSDFKTIRGIGIGDDYSKVINTYPKAEFYKKESKDSKWRGWDHLDINKINFTGGKIPKNLGYIVIRRAYYQYNRNIDIDFPLHYELVFVLDKGHKVKSILLCYSVDAI